MFKDDRTRLGSYVIMYVSLPTDIFVGIVAMFSVLACCVCTEPYTSNYIEDHYTCLHNVP